MFRPYNYLLLALLACGLMTNRPAQAQTADSVSTGAGYTQQVWYNLETGQAWSANAADWDLAFATSGMGSSIRINGGQGVRLWRYPDGDTADWATLDTTGMAENWPELHNDPAEWAMPAFSQGKITGDAFDLGWGRYSMVTHHVTGDSLYVIQDVEGTYGKLWIERLASGTYTFRYEELGSGNSQSFSLAKDDYDDRFHGYFSLKDSEARDLEPATDEWDVLFTRYITFLPTGPTPTPYSVTGVLLHPDARAIEVNNVADPATEPQPDTANFLRERNVIGYDWKSFVFQERRYAIEDSLVYFVEDAEGDVFRFIPTAFGGSANGMYYFESEKTSTATGQHTWTAGGIDLDVYPNPVTGGVCYLRGLEEVREPMRYHLHDLQGRRLKEGLLNAGAQARIDVHELPHGLYLLHVQSGNSTRIAQIQIQ